jgi:isopenicillin N synthase-like dioxygenase
MTEISVLDAALFLHGTDSQKSLFAKQLLSSCQQCGFVKIINHGIPDSFILELFKMV